MAGSPTIPPRCDDEPGERRARRHSAPLVDARNRVVVDDVRQRVHQRRGVSDPHVARAPRAGPRRRRPDVRAAEHRHGGHAVRVGLRGRPPRRAPRARPRFRAYRRRRVRGRSVAHSLVTGTFLLLGGMAAASSNSASGRLVVGWFPAEQRGLAMGIRQTAQPLGVGLGALVIPRLAQSTWHRCGVALPRRRLRTSRPSVSAVGVLDPPRPPREHAQQEDLANPYRGSSVLWRIHAVSVLLVVPQVMVWTFTLVWLMTDRGWSAGSAGALVTVAQVLGALGRVAAGRWSDRVGSRLRPVRTIATAAALTMGLLALTDYWRSPVCRRGDGRRVRGHGQRQRSGVHRDRRDRRDRSGAVARWARRTPASC